MRVPAVLVLALPLALGACAGFRTPFDSLLAPPQAPDAFLVLSRAPLQMPPSLALPEPRPGAVSPLEPTPLVDAQVALLGRPVDAAGGAAPSAGEQSLLAAAGAAAADPDIRATLVAEADPDRADKPYEAPSLFALVFGDETLEPEDVIDPGAEARRLAAEGVITPLDPNALPPEAPLPNRADTFGTNEYPPLGSGNQRPQNTFTGY